MHRAVLALIALLVASGPSPAGSSAWQSFEGADLRLLVSDAADEDGKLRAALEIALKPGWKTYWLDPGGSGVPPTVDATVDGSPAATAIGMPAPKRVSDGYSTFAGYDAPIAMALTIAPQDAGRPAGSVDVSVFLGVCETICVPVQAAFSVPLSSGSTPGGAAVAAAFEALPAEPRDGFGVTRAWTSGDELIVEVAVPQDAEIELFIASTGSFILGEPAGDGRSGFRVPLLDRPSAPGVIEEARYTLVAGDEAVSGTFRIAGHP